MSDTGARCIARAISNLALAVVFVYVLHKSEYSWKTHFDIFKREMLG